MIDPATELAAVRYLWRHPANMSLYGLKSELRLNQAPKDLWEAGRLDLFCYLGNPGWWGSMSKEAISAAKEFLAAHKDAVPNRPGEWSSL